MFFWRDFLFTHPCKIRHYKEKKMAHIENWSNTFELMNEHLPHAGDTNQRYLISDSEIDKKEIAKYSLDSQFLWLLRENGSELINLSLPRSKKVISEILDKNRWKKIIHIQSDKPLKVLSQDQAQRLAAGSKPYTVRSNDGKSKEVIDPNGFTVATFYSNTVNSKVSEFNVQFSIGELERSNPFDLSNISLNAQKMHLLERVVLDHLITQEQTLFAKTNNFYEIDGGRFLVKSFVLKDALNEQTPVIIASHQGNVIKSGHLPCTSVEEVKDLYLDGFKSIVRNRVPSIKGYKFEVVQASDIESTMKRRVAVKPKSSLEI